MQDCSFEFPKINKNMLSVVIVIPCRERVFVIKSVIMLNLTIFAITTIDMLVNRTEKNKLWYWTKTDGRNSSLWQNAKCKKKNTQN